MSPEERAAGLYRWYVSPRTGEFENRPPTSREIADAIRAAVAAERARLLAAIRAMFPVDATDCAGWLFDDQRHALAEEIARRLEAMP